MKKSFPKILGAKLYLVGGCVRDILLNKETNDRDFVAVTDMSFKGLVKAIETEPANQIFMAKEEFLTVRCKIDGEVVDVALPRTDQDYNDGRHPENVTRVETLKDDSARRDFTVNSMFMNENGKVLDKHNGLKDLKAKLIRTVGEPNFRFDEDYLRILRAIRFAISLDFEIEPLTFSSMQLKAHNLEKISTDRIRNELNKCLLKSPYKTIKYIEDLKIDKILNEKGLHFQMTNRKLKR